MSRPIRVLTTQWAGDYREAYERLAAGGEETYNAQRYSIETVGTLASGVEQCGVQCLVGERAYDAVVGNGVRSLCAGLSHDANDLGPAIAQIEHFAPTHLILTTPRIELLDWALSRHVDLLPMFADSFESRSAGLTPPRRLARWARHARYRHRLARRLSDERVRWVSNHNLLAARSLVALGVRPSKVVPWDWPATRRPEQFAPKSRRPDDAPWELLFVGNVSEAKGVGDGIAAVAELRRRGRPATLRVIGPGDEAGFARLARELGVAEVVQFEGRQPQPRVVEAMLAADLVLVPSHHAYPEGLPMVIYEALATRTPLICSDHPMFRGQVGEGLASLCVPEKRPEALAEAAERVLTDPERYARMSLATAEAWRRIQCPVLRDELIRRWLAATPDDDRWLAEHSLASGLYDHR